MKHSPTSPKESASIETTNKLSYAPEDFQWPRCPEAEQFLQENIDHFLENHTFARELKKRMWDETSTRFFDWIDHIALPLRAQLLTKIDATGFVNRYQYNDTGEGISYWHPHAEFPDILLKNTSEVQEVAIKVESIEDFLKAHKRTDCIDQIEGAPYSHYRRISFKEGDFLFTVIERRGYTGFTPDNDSKKEELHASAKALWDERVRVFRKNEERGGMNYTLELAQTLVEKVGKNMAADIVMQCEREYWEKRNLAARIQKKRQDVLGLGWANHDHHTFRSSRKHFLKLIEIFQTLGFQKRERYSPPDADWGAQIFEQPDAGIVIFADVDLFPEEKHDDFDFSVQPLPAKKKYFTVGRWCALHGDSILQAGMHHLEAQFDFEQLKIDLQNRNIYMIDPFSNEIDEEGRLYLKQTFTESAQWIVPHERLETALSQRAINRKTHDQIQANAMIAAGSTLENLERNMGYKGFKQEGVSDVLNRVDPKKLAEASEETRRKLADAVSSRS